jgi:hypothetical protein
MRVTVNAAMRARDVSRPEVERKLEDQPPGAAPPGAQRAAAADQAGVNRDQPGGRADRDARADRDQGARADRAQEALPERTRPSKAERRRLGKRRARARR